MKHDIASTDSVRILYDPDLVSFPEKGIFDAENWPNVVPVNAGRGEAYFVSSDERQWLIKTYCRGGFIRRLARKSYFFFGFARTRMFQEFLLLQYLIDRKVAVPRPVAALVENNGMFYQGQIILQQLQGYESLSDLLAKKLATFSQWEAVGTCIARLHREHIDHTDLNVTNILLRNNSVFIIDFDRCAKRRFGFFYFRKKNIKRFNRSIDKLMKQGVQITLEERKTFEIAYKAGLS